MLIIEVLRRGFKTSKKVKTKFSTAFVLRSSSEECTLQVTECKYIAKDVTVRCS